jgi:hypothetical protein
MGIRLLDEDLILVEVSQTEGESILLPDELSQGNRSFWCWAACGELIINFIKSSRSVTQCSLAHEYANPTRTNCCDFPMDCDFPMEKEEIKKIYEQRSIQVWFLDLKNFTNEEIIDLIKQQMSPPKMLMELYYKIEREKGHLVVLNGWGEDIDGKEVFFIKDPATRDDLTYTLEELLSEKGLDACWVFKDPGFLV